MSATLTVLGAGSIVPRVGYGCAGYALRPAPGAPVTLLDCGPGTVRNLAAAGITVEEVERVVLSHYHLDHCLDLFALAFARRNPALGAVGAIELIGPAGLRARMEGVPDALGHWAAMPRSTLREVAPGERLERGGLVWRSTANGHTPEALSWRVDDAQGAWSLVYTGDTGPDPRVAELARGADVLVCECSFPDDQAVANHLTPGGAGALARAAGVKRLVLTHFYPSMDPAAAGARAAEVFGGPVELARDGLVVALAEDRGRA
jgi:ribonuclease BN (tRNA processing enzyme)